MRELYSDRRKRDARYRELKAQGYHPIKEVVKNQQLHPMYVEDLKAGIAGEDKGFGNDIYRTFFSRLYVVETTER